MFVKSVELFGGYLKIESTHLSLDEILENHFRLVYFNLNRDGVSCEWEWVYDDGNMEINGVYYDNPLIVKKNTNGYVVKIPFIFLDNLCIGVIKESGFELNQKKLVEYRELFPLIKLNPGALMLCVIEKLFW